MRNRILIGTITTVTILYWLVLLFKIDIFQFIPGYTWHFMFYSNKPLEYMALIVPLAIISYFVISYVLKKPEYHKRNLLMLIILGYLIQMGFGLMEGRGIDGIREKMLATGHSEFAKIASSGIDIMDVAKNYEQGLESNESILFAKTKPPGHLLFYMLTEKLSNLISPSSDPEKRFQTLGTFASFLYPLLSYLIIIPLFYISRFFIKKESAILPCILYLFIPSVTLVTLHLDQVLYPLLFILALLLILNGCKKDKILLSVLSGGFIYFALYFSFSLLPIVPFGLLIGASYIYCYSTSDNKFKSMGRFVVGLIIGWIVVQLLFWFLLDYNIFIRYQNAMIFHHSWKGWDGRLSTTVLYGILNYIEFACWLGLPLAILFISKIKALNISSLKDHLTFENLFLLATLFIFVLLGFFGKTKSEVGRLWIFMMPVVLIVVSFAIQDRFQEKFKRVLWFFLTFQLLSIMFIKRFQDLW